jgi:hypothetical protein
MSQLRSHNYQACASRRSSTTLQLVLLFGRVSLLSDNNSPGSPDPKPRSYEIHHPVRVVAAGTRTWPESAQAPHLAEEPAANLSSSAGHLTLLLSCILYCMSQEPVTNIHPKGTQTTGDPSLSIWHSGCRGRRAHKADLTRLFPRRDPPKRLDGGRVLTLHHSQTLSDG